MTKVQVVYASRHGGTAGIAARIATVLHEEGLEVQIAEAAGKPDPAGFDAYVVGSGVYMGSWLGDGVDFLERNTMTLAMRPTWLFSSGPLPSEAKPIDTDDPLTTALGPATGPGSIGHRRIADLSAAIRPRGHRVFLGRFDPTDPPKTLPERLVRLMPLIQKILPTGDFREWDVIEAWAREIARALQPAVAREPAVAAV